MHYRESTRPSLQYLTELKEIRKELQLFQQALHAELMELYWGSCGWANILYHSQKQVF